MDIFDNFSSRKNKASIFLRGIKQRNSVWTVCVQNDVILIIFPWKLRNAKASCTKFLSAAILEFTWVQPTQCDRILWKNEFGRVFWQRNATWQFWWGGLGGRGDEQWWRQWLWAWIFSSNSKGTWPSRGVSTLFTFVSQWNQTFLYLLGTNYNIMQLELIIMLATSVFKPSWYDLKDFTREIHRNEWISEIDLWTLFYGSCLVHQSDIACARDS